MAAISSVGSTYHNFGSGQTTLSAVNPTAIGDLLVVMIGYSSGTPAVSALAHTGVTTWTFLNRTINSTTFGAEVWMGVVTATGSATLTETFSPSNSGIGSFTFAQQFTAGPGAVWALDGTQAGGANGSPGIGLPYNLPTLTPAAAGELYVASSREGGSAITAVPTAGYSSFLLNGSPTNSVGVWNPACSGAAQSPTMTQTAGSNQPFAAAAALITATVPGQNANFFPLLRGA